MRIENIDISEDTEFKNKQGTEITLDAEDVWKQSRHKGMGVIYTLLTNWKSNKEYGIIDFKSVSGTDLIIVYVRGDRKRAEYLVENIQDQLNLNDVPKLKVISYTPTKIIRLDVWDDDLENYADREIRVDLNYEL
jgi:hypothetical protein